MLQGIGLWVLVNNGVFFLASCEADPIASPRLGVGSYFGMDQVGTFPAVWMVRQDEDTLSSAIVTIAVINGGGEAREVAVCDGRMQ